MDFNETQSVEDVVTISGDDNANRFGFRCAGIGDFNNDSIDDLACSDKYFSLDQANRGAVYVFFGKPGTWDNLVANETTSMVIQGAVEARFVGISLSGAGDMNNDGVGDMTFGEANSSSAVVYVMLGISSHAPGIYDLSEFTSGDTGFKTTHFSGIASDDHTAMNAGDLNGDGFDDLMIAARNTFEESEYSLGTVFVLWGGHSEGYEDVDLDAWDDSKGFRIDGTVENIYTGMRIAALGDIDGDEYPDIAFTGFTSDFSSAVCTIVYGMENASQYIDSDFDSLETHGYRILVTSDVLQVARGGKVSDVADTSLVMAYPFSSNGGVAYVLHAFENITASPTSSPTNSPSSSPTAPTESPSDAPTTSPTSSPTVSPTLLPSNSPSKSPTVDTCVIEVSTQGSGVSWLISDSGDLEIASGELGRISMSVNLDAAENYLMFVSSMPQGGKVTLSVNGGAVKTFTFLTEITSSTEIAGVTCDEISYTLTQEVDSAFATSIALLSLLVTIVGLY